MSKIGSFIKYHNAVPLVAAALFLSFGGALAASPDVRDAIYSSTTEVRSIDNTYLAGKDLRNYTPTVRITGVTEDADNYYIAYMFSTIDVVDYVWRDVTTDRVITVAKDVLTGKDLGLYVTEQLKQVIGRDIAYLKEAQERERRQVSQKTVATAYSGLVGAFIDDKTETLPGYTPPQTPDTGEQTTNVTTDGQAAGGGNGQVAGDSTSTKTPSSGSATGSDSTDRTPPVIQILGNNPARIYAGASYSDLGAVVTDNVNDNLGYQLTLDGRAVTEISIDTRKEGTHTIRYTTTDQAGNSAFAERIVEVYFDPAHPLPQTGTPAPSPEGTSAPAPQETSTSTPS